MQWSKSFEQDSPKIIPSPWGLHCPLRVKLAQALCKWLLLEDVLVNVHNYNLCFHSLQKNLAHDWLLFMIVCGICIQPSLTFLITTPRSNTSNNNNNNNNNTTYIIQQNKIISSSVTYLHVFLVLWGQSHEQGGKLAPTFCELKGKCCEYKILTTMNPPHHCFIFWDPPPFTFLTTTH